ncbi:MAG: class I SAM-dependent methyltransferase [Thioalkalivibrionaceae bacterium]
MSEWTRATDFADAESRARLRARLAEPLEITFDVGAVGLQLSTTWGLFSPRELDTGSRLLLEELERRWQREPPDAVRSVCDLGCGYGPLGLWIRKRLGSECRAVLLDKDVTAVEFARRNAERIACASPPPRNLQQVRSDEELSSDAMTTAGFEVLLSDGFAALPRDARFDLVVSNVPAKIGREALYAMLLDAHRHLVPGGEIWVVTITGLRRFIEGAFRDVFDDYDKIKQGRDYTVARAQRSDFGDRTVDRGPRSSRTE